MSSRRQEIYDRIRQSSKKQYIIDEMIRLGFWQPDARQAEKGEELERISRELNALHTEASRLRNIEAMRKEAHRRRLAEAKERREETKRRRLKLREHKAQRWRFLKTRDVVYLGAGVSTGLSDTSSKAATRMALGLPDLPDPRALAQAMGVKVGTLRWLAFHRKVSATTHYQRFVIPKKTGGERLISAPMPRLKATQHWILEHLLSPVPLHHAAHGFVPGRSIMSNAQPHVGAAIVINLDLKDFFPSVGWLRVRGLFQSLGYSPQIATILALLSTEAEVQEVEIDGRRWYVHASERHLPQGSPASPAITNLLCRRLDKRLFGLAAKAGFTYTRYADDLTFSTRDKGADVGRLIGAVRRIVTAEGFVVHPDKTRVMRRGRRMEVTGLVVNDRLGVPRATLNRFRAALFKAERDGPADVRWGSAHHAFDALLGFAGFVRMVDPGKGGPLLDRVRAAIEAHGWRRPHRVPAPKRAPIPEPIEELPVEDAGPAVADEAPAPEASAEPIRRRPRAERGRRSATDAHGSQRGGRERGRDRGRDREDDEAPSSEARPRRGGRKRGGFRDFKDGDIPLHESEPEPIRRKPRPKPKGRKWWEIWKK